MVLKLSNGIYNWVVEFESSVNSDGTQTVAVPIASDVSFESSVNSDGTQTLLYWKK